MDVKDLLNIIEVANFSKGQILELVEELTDRALTEKVGDIVDVRFPIINKNHEIADNDDWIKKESQVNQCEIKKILTVSDSEYKEMSNSLLDDNHVYEKIGGASIDDKYLEGIQPGSDEYYQAWKWHGVTNVVKVTNGKESFYVNTEGYGYARYVGRSAKEWQQGKYQ